MISSLLAANAAPIPARAPATSSDRRTTAVADLPRPLDGKALRKEMASRRLQALEERMRTLKMMIGVDPRAALKMTAALAKELKGAVKDYQDAGGRNVSDADMALIRKQASDARDAQAASGTVRAEPSSSEAAAPDVVADAEAKRARQAYAAASAEAEAQAADRWGRIESAALADKGFFDRVKGVLGGLRKARDEIRAASGLSLHKPTDDDWKEADKAQAEVERQVATAPGGFDGPASVKV